MRKGILWMLVSFLLVAALALASCAPAVGEQEEEEEEEEPVVPGEQEEEEEEEEPAVGEPQYGGTLTFLTYRREQEPTTFDQADGSYTLSAYGPPYMESLVTGDVEKYGPRGTDEFAFELNEFIPDRFLRGQLAESWEVSTDPLGVTFHIRKGIMWQANPHIGFEPREYTAYDGAFCMNRYRAAPVGQYWLSYIPEGGFEALGRYTLFAHFDKFSCTWPLTFGYGYFAMHYPPEVVEAGAADWRNQTGTGPFMIKEFVKGSHITYRKNLDWWDSEKIINGEKYDAPFIDELTFPIILDESTRISSLRTGKIDLAHMVKMRYLDTLSSSCPDLIIQKYRAGACSGVTWKAAPGCLMADKNLRRAMFIGTDLRTIIKAVHTEGDVHCIPYSAGFPTDIYTPIEDLPSLAKELYTYDPEKAAQMIVDAGYPDGFTIKLDFSATRGEQADQAAMLANQWAKIGVRTILQPRDHAVLLGLSSSGEYEHGLIAVGGNASTVSRLDSFRIHEWLPFYGDEYWNESVDRAGIIIDETERNVLLKELGIYAIDTAWRIPLGNPYLLCCYWPWVKNYYGEIEGGFTNYSAMVSSLWIDQALKAEMGY